MGNNGHQPDRDTAFRCIAIETATERGSVAVSDGENVFNVKLGTEKGSSRQIFGAIREALSRADMSQSSLTCVAFGNGPGSFTGVRVAASAAQSLAFALQVPVIAVSTLAAVAIEAGRTRGAEPIAVCLDARMGEAYAGVYRFDATGLAVPLLADGLVNPDTFILPAAPSLALAAGPGWSAYPQMLAKNRDRISAVVDDIWPGAAAIAVEAQELFRQGRVLLPQDALPNYVRNKVTHQKM
jgi:tRNA threonylcarbamoyladenosine biosynthesis protein TsaB